MKIETKNYKVVIFNQEYHLISDETQEHILEASAIVDQIMQSLAGDSSRVDITKLAVLAALQCASTMIKTKHALNRRKKHEQAFVERAEQILSSL